MKKVTNNVTQQEMSKKHNTSSIKKDKITEAHTRRGRNKKRSLQIPLTGAGGGAAGSEGFSSGLLSTSGT